MRSFTRRKGITIFLLAASLLWVIATSPAQATQIGSGDFTNPITINFNDAPNALIDGFYSSLGVTFVNMSGGNIYDTGTGEGYSESACNFFDSPGFPPGELRFSPPSTRAGFFITTNPGDDTAITAFLAGSPVGSETFITSGSGGGGSFAGVEFGSPFDRLVIDPADNTNGAFCIDNLMFEANTGITVIPADLDMMPNTINKKSKGQYITAYIEFPDSAFSPADVDVSTVTIQAVDPVTSAKLYVATGSPTEVGDSNGNGIVDLMVKFDRATAQSWFSSDTTATFRVEGHLFNGTAFQGDTSVRIIDAGAEHNDEASAASVKE